ncbi:serine/threonine-protein kinase [Spiroplasma culicicola]|uniref:non-specific serine/threonine protein kinase n=1 Tax=Spiroplasma culicicola AES-1 TaxID=1276246 RepID=W6AHP1_9MOLU|nr:serine/threonine-protein kinase [Spiroplasma culicicola]AHI53194.1 serine/threonine protein kinase [Spiroplasma culicicola AES-1]
MNKYEPGAIIQERYEIISAIGKGGMASVFKAHDIITDQIVAIKVASPEILLKQTGQERFEIENEAFAKLGENPHVIKLHDVIQQGSEWLIILECVEGGTLKDRFQEFGAMTLKEIKYYFSNLCDALQAAHDLKIVHRDVKPENVLLTLSGEVKLGDFGISVMEGYDSEAKKAIGTPRYMPPEIIESKLATPRSDIYSLGIMMYEFATGTAPFIASDGKKVAAKQVKEKPTSPRLINPMIPQSLENIILKMIEKNPENRYASMNEIRRDLMNVKITDSPKPYNYHLKVNYGAEHEKQVFKIGSTYEKLPAIARSKYVITFSILLLLLVITFFAALIFI